MQGHRHTLIFFLFLFQIVCRRSKAAITSTHALLMQYCYAEAEADHEPEIETGMIVDAVAVAATDACLLEQTDVGASATSED